MKALNHFCMLACYWCCIILLSALHDVYVYWSYVCTVMVCCISSDICNPLGCCDANDAGIIIAFYVRDVTWRLITTGRYF